MSAIGKINLELEEQAQELGFEGLEEAQEAGCVVEWHEDSAELLDPLEAAHRAWEKEKQEILNVINNPEWMAENMDYGDMIDFLLNRVAPFIQEARF